MALRIEDYALIGDCKTAALVGRDGSIDWLCWPRFDSPACFAALLGTADNGRWLIAPAQSPVTVSRQYRPGTLILETEFQSETGNAAIIDFMPLGDGADLVRIVVGRSGRMEFRTEIVVRFNYGATVPWVSRPLIDNDRVQADLKDHLERAYGAAARDRYWEILERLRSELGYVDYLGALERFRIETIHRPDVLRMSSWLVDYPFADRLYPGALDVSQRAGT